MSELNKLFFPFFNLHLNSRLEPFLHEDYLRYDKFMLYLIFIHWITATFITSVAYDTYLFGLSAGGVIMGVTTVVFLRFKGTRVFRLMAALALISFSAIFIQQHLAAATTLHHFFFNLLQTTETAFFDTNILIFNYGCGFDIVALHTLFILFETIMLLYIIVLRQIAYQKVIQTSNRLAYLNDNLEKEVARKTRAVQENMLALQKANHALLEAKNRAIMASEARTNFISSVSHELRTPLNSIINFTDMVLEDFDVMLENEMLREENRDFLGRVLKNSRHLLALINDILEYTKAESGKITFEMDRFNIIPLVQNAFANCRGLLSDSPVDYHLEIDPTPLFVTLDKRRFFQILLNLISNAIKFTQNGFVIVRCFERDGEVFLEVADSGRGIPEEKLETIFQPFEQVTLDDAGTGLGLVIVKKLCESMQIKLDVASEFGKGTTFTLTMKKAVHDPSR